MSRPELSVVIPAFDEERRIDGSLVLTRAFFSARPGSFEIIVVDDGSSDRTRDIVIQHAAEDARVKLVALPRNRGKGAAVREGMQRAQGKRALFMDADLATPLAELDKLERALAEGADIAIGSRGLPDSELAVRQHPAREAMGRTFNLLVRTLVLPGYQDTQCGFKLFSRRAIDTLFAEAKVDRFAFDVELLLLARGRFRVSEVPIAWHHVAESKISPLRDAARMAYDLLKLRLDVALRPPK